MSRVYGIVVEWRWERSREMKIAVQFLELVCVFVLLTAACSFSAHADVAYISDCLGNVFRIAVEEGVVAEHVSQLPRPGPRTVAFASIAYRANSSQLYVFSAYDATVVWVDVQTGEVSHTEVPGIKNFQGKSFFSADGEYLFVTALLEDEGGEWSIVLDADTLNIVARLKGLTAAFSDDSSFLYYRKRGRGEIGAYSLTDGTETVRCRFDGSLSCRGIATEDKEVVLFLARNDVIGAYRVVGDSCETLSVTTTGAPFRFNPVEGPYRFYDSARMVENVVQKGTGVAMSFDASLKAIEPEADLGLVGYPKLIGHEIPAEMDLTRMKVSSVAYTDAYLSPDGDYSFLVYDPGRGQGFVTVRDNSTGAFMETLKLGEGGLTNLVFEK